MQCIKQKTRLGQLIIAEPLFGKSLILCAGTAIVGVGMDADAAARDEEAENLDVAGGHKTDEVVEDDVDAVLVEVAMVSEGEEIEFQALTFHHALVGNIKNLDFGEVGLPSDWAERGELGTVELHPIIAFGMTVLEGFEHLGGIVLGNLGLAAKGLEIILFSVHSCILVGS